MNNPQVFDLVVIGCGPAGIAALFQSKLNGINALGIEAGETPLNHIREYPDGSIFSSPAEHFQIHDIPLDCKQWDQVTKEEVLYYYSRIINYRGLDIQCNHKFVGLQKQKECIAVVCDTPNGKKKILGKRVIFTAWYKRNKLSIPGARGSQIKILPNILNSIQCAGKRTVVIGGGLSACESAIFLMMNGQRITLLARGKKAGFHYNKEFNKLLTLTGSEVIVNASVVRLFKNKMAVKLADKSIRIECDFVIAPVGQTIDDASLNALKRFNVISEGLSKRIKASVPFDKLARMNGAKSLEKSFLDQAALNWPDLHQHLIRGRKRVHLAGAALHIGSSSAGVKMSIHTSILAVNAICKKMDTKLITRPLPVYLLGVFTKPEWITNLPVFGHIRPLTVKCWTRNTIHISGIENSNGQFSPQKPHAYFLGKIGKAKIELIMSLCDGTNTLEEVIKKCCKNGNELKAILEIFYHLFYNNGLTWLPPIR